jgi:hypothetical protein
MQSHVYAVWDFVIAQGFTAAVNLYNIALGGRDTQLRYLINEIDLQKKQTKILVASV